ncbi:MAG: SOS response-associated peptidase family protein [Mailhella sp.]|nr:SOS response-associated peptidase family protein [Mailhella sp.]
MCCSFNFQGRNIRPSDNATVLTAVSSPLQLQFGFRLPDGRLVINARSETVMKKPMFRNLLRYGRVVIPADCFHEWDKSKVKYTFTLPDRQQMFFAGLRDQNSFVILTTAANRSMIPVHDRMPLILEDAQGWLRDGDDYKNLLGLTPPELIRQAGIRQGSLL